MLLNSVWHQVDTYVLRMNIIINNDIRRFHAKRVQFVTNASAMNGKMLHFSHQMKSRFAARSRYTCTYPMYGMYGHSVYTEHVQSMYRVTTYRNRRMMKGSVPRGDGEAGLNGLGLSLNHFKVLLYKAK